MTLTKKQIRELAKKLTKAEDALQTAIAETNRAGIRLEANFHPVKVQLLYAEEQVESVRQSLQEAGAKEPSERQGVID